MPDYPIPNRHIEMRSTGSGTVKSYTLTPEELARYRAKPAPTDYDGRKRRKPIKTIDEQRKEPNEMTKYSHITKEFLEKEFAAGKSGNQVEREQGMPPGTISHMCRRFGVKSQHAEKGKKSEATKPAATNPEVERLRLANDAIKAECDQLRTDHATREEELQRAIADLETERDLLLQRASTSTMTLNQYQELASRTANTDWERIAIRLLREPELLPLLNFSLGAAGEAGEIADEVKKVIFHGHELNRDKLIKEFGDLLWYVSQLSGLFGSLDTVAEQNIDKLRARYPEGFSEVRSRERKVSGE